MVDDRDLLADVLDQLELVAGEQHRGAAGRLAAENVGHGAHGNGIESGERLVEDEQLRLMDERGRELHPLLVAVRELLHGRAVAVGETEPLEPARCGGACRTRGQPVQTSEVLELIAHPHSRVEAALLGHVSEPQPLLQTDRAPVPTHLATVELDETEDRAHDRRLSGPVRTEEAEHPAAPHVEAQAVEGDGRVVSFRQRDHLKPSRLRAPCGFCGRLWGRRLCRMESVPGECLGGHDQSAYAKSTTAVATIIATAAAISVCRSRRPLTLKATKTHIGASRARKFRFTSRTFFARTNSATMAKRKSSPIHSGGAEAAATPRIRPLVLHDQVGGGHVVYLLPATEWTRCAGESLAARSSARPWIASQLRASNAGKRLNGNRHSSGSSAPPKIVAAIGSSSGVPASARSSCLRDSATFDSSRSPAHAEHGETLTGELPSMVLQ